MIEKMALRYAYFIDKHATKPSSIAVNKYGAQTLMEFLLFCMIIMLVTSLFGDIKKGIIALVAFPFLRFFSGGMHMKSVEVCQLVSAGIVIAAIYVPLSYSYIGIVLNFVSIAILFYTAPSNIRRSKIDPKYYPIVKVVAILIVASNFLFNSDLLAKVFFVQSLTTLSFFQRKILEYRL